MGLTVIVPPPSGVTNPDDFWGSVATQFILSSGNFPSPNDLTGQDIVIKDMLALKTFVVSNSNLSTVTMSNCPALEFLVVSSNPLFLNGPDLHLLPALNSVEMSQNDSMVDPPNVSGLTSLYSLIIGNNPSMTSWPDISGLTAIGGIELSANDAMTIGPDASGLTTLEAMSCSQNATMATAPNVSGDTSLLALTCNDNPVMATAPDVTGCTLLKTITVAGCALPESEVDALLAQVDTNGIGTGTLTLDLSGGTNAAPGAPGIISQSNLVNKTWTVTTNSTDFVVTNAQKLALTGLVGGENAYVADACIIGGAGDSALNGMYRRTSGTTKGRYNLIGSGSSSTTNVCKWLTNKWLIAASTGIGNNYESTDNVNYPWQVTTWTVGGSGTGPVPTVDTHPVHQTYDGGGESDEANWTIVP